MKPCWHKVHPIHLESARGPAYSTNGTKSLPIIIIYSAGLCIMMMWGTVDVLYASWFADWLMLLSLCDEHGWMWDVDVCSCKSYFKTLPWLLSFRRTCFRWANFFVTSRSNVKSKILEGTPRYFAIISFKLGNVISSGILTFPSVNMVSIVQFRYTSNISPWWCYSSTAVKLGISNLALFD